MEFVLKGGARRRYGEPNRWLAVVLLLAPIATACTRTPPSGMSIEQASLMLALRADDASPITGIEIVPSMIVVQTDLANPTRFKLEARLWTGPAANRMSSTDSTGFPLQWSVTQSWLKVIDQDGYSATVLIEPGMPPSISAFVKVTAGGLAPARSAEIRVTPASASAQDVLDAIYTEGTTPSVVVVHGMRGAAGGPCTDSLVAFLRSSALGTLYSQCKEIGRAHV